MSPEVPAVSPEQVTKIQVQTQIKDRGTGKGGAASLSLKPMFINDLGRDLRIGLRVLLKEKVFCALGVTVLALGIGGVSTMFSVVNGVMLRGFSFPNADRLMSVNFV